MRRKIGGSRLAQVAAAAVAVAAAAVLAAAARPALAGPRGGPAQTSSTAYVPSSLLARAQANPNATFDVIVQGEGDDGADVVQEAFGHLPQSRSSRYGEKLQSIAGGTATVTGSQLVQLASTNGVAAITQDAEIHLAGSVNSYSNPQLWPWAVGAPASWSLKGRKAGVPAIAIVDSGIQKNRDDFNGGSVIKTVQIATGPDNSGRDGYGHGTFVAGIAAGGARGYTGATPAAPLVSLDVLDNQGEGKVSDVIAACDWILANAKKYDIRVVNFSLSGSSPASVFWDPLDRAVEELWFSGITVVAAAGNYASSGAESGVMYAPANDPFVITVGADNIAGTVSPADDTAAPWSAWGYTADGFAKPELGAPGRYMVGPTPARATLAAERPGSMVGSDYIQLSGTSFAAPVVSGAAAYLLAVHPTWTPDQVKGALMVSAQNLPAATPRSLGVGLLDVPAAAAVSSPPNPNLALDQFVVPDPAGGPIPVFDAASWSDAARNDASWSDASWSDASWSDASWSDASWSDAAFQTASWSDASWSDASWSDASWSDASWSDASWSDNAADETATVPLLDTTQAGVVSSEFGLTPSPDGSLASGP